MSKEKTRTYYETVKIADGEYVLKCNDIDSLKKAIEDGEDANFILEKKDGSSIELTFLIDGEGITEGTLHTQEILPDEQIDKEVYEGCLFILNDFADESWSDKATIRYKGKYYPATMWEPAEYPDAYAYCWNCGELLEENPEEGEWGRCDCCGAPNEVDFNAYVEDYEAAMGRRF